LELSLAETPKNEDLLIASCHFWSNGVKKCVDAKSAPQRSAPFESEFSFYLLLALVRDLVLYPLFVFFSLDLFPKEIFGTEETPEYISSDSSLEAEDATPEQRTNHQLRRRVRHLEHGLRDITARCQVERERRMDLEALVGGKHSHIHFDSMLAPRSLFLNNCSSASDVSDKYSNLKAAWDNLMEAASHGHTPQLPSCRHGGPGTTEEGGAEEAKKKGLRHTFASYARPSASHPFMILSNLVVRYNPARSICNVVSC
jgi:hypothetical protein